jgi:type I restriction enzyme S subunit
MLTPEQRARERIDDLLQAAGCSVEALERSVEANLTRAERLRQGILKKAFGGWLMHQDPADEPASALLERIRAQRPVGKGKRKKPRQQSLPMT